MSNQLTEAIDLVAEKIGAASEQVLPLGRTMVAEVQAFGWVLIGATVAVIVLGVAVAAICIKLNPEDDFAAGVIMFTFVCCLLALLPGLIGAEMVCRATVHVTKILLPG